MIEVNNLRKEFTTYKTQAGFKGAVKSLFNREVQTKVAVEDVSFNVGKGEIIGYLGPNGAGKSTTIKMITGILSPSSGKCLINGIVPYENRKENAKQIGVVFGQRTQLWWDLPLTETFSILKKIYKVDDREFKTRFDLLREILDLDEFLNSTVRTLSLGQRMRADLAAALIHNPKVLFLDEPTIGLDIVVKDKIREAIKNFRDENGTTIILTTHDMSDIEHLCKRILVIDKGKMIYDGQIDKLKNIYGNSRNLTFAVEGDKKRISTDLIKLMKSRDPMLEVNSIDNKLLINHNKNNIDTLDIINKIAKEIEVKDISINDMPIGDIIKNIYLNK